MMKYIGRTTDELTAVLSKHLEAEEQLTTQIRLLLAQSPNDKELFTVLIEAENHTQATKKLKLDIERALRIRDREIKHITKKTEGRRK